MSGESMRQSNSSKIAVVFSREEPCLWGRAEREASQASATATATMRTARGGCFAGYAVWIAVSRPLFVMAPRDLRSHTEGIIVLRDFVAEDGML